MIIACIIISSLALLAAVTVIILFAVDKKRDQLRNQALLNYVSNVVEGAQEETEDFLRDLISKKTKEFNTEYSTLITGIDERFNKIVLEVANLKNGSDPDYEKALAAAKAVNDFNSSIISIMNFDPIETARKKRANGSKEGD